MCVLKFALIFRVHRSPRPDACSPRCRLCRLHRCRLRALITHLQLFYGKSARAHAIRVAMATHYLSRSVSLHRSKLLVARCIYSHDAATLTLYVCVPLPLLAAAVAVCRCSRAENARARRFRVFVQCRLRLRLRRHRAENKTQSPACCVRICVLYDRLRGGEARERWSPCASLWV